MGFGAMLGNAAKNLVMGRNASSGPSDGPQMKRKDSAIGMAMKGVMKLKKRSQAKKTAMYDRPGTEA